MKKYIIGLFSAICLMGAGCTEFEDFTPVDMGEGPAVTVTAEKTAVDAFKVTITPAEGTVYYSYIVTDEAMTVDPDQLLQAKYEGSTLVKATEKPSVSGTLSNQNLGATYYMPRHPMKKAFAGLWLRHLSNCPTKRLLIW